MYISATECYSASRKREILSLGVTWRDLEDVMLQEISQTQKDQNCMVLTYMWNLKKVKLLKAESRMVLARELGGGGTLQRSGLMTSVREPVVSSRC